jgi:hypothetical protein
MELHLHSSQYIFMAWCLVKHRETLLLQLRTHNGREGNEVGFVSTEALGPVRIKMEKVGRNFGV